MFNVAFICNSLNSLRLWFWSYLWYFPKPCFCPHYDLSCQKLHLFQKLTWYCSLTSLFNLLRSAVSTSNLCYLFTCWQCLWNLCSHWIVIVITVPLLWEIRLERLDVEYNWMQSPGCQDMIHLIVSFLSGEVQMYLWMFHGGVLCFEQLHVFDMAKFTARTPSWLLFSHKHLFQFDVLKTASLSNFALKSRNRISFGT